MMSEEIIKSKYKEKISKSDKIIILTFLITLVLFLIMYIIDSFLLFGLLPVIIICETIIMITYLIFLFTEDEEKPYMSTPNDSMDTPDSIERQIILKHDYLKIKRKRGIAIWVFFLFVIFIGLYFVLIYNEIWLLIFCVMFLVLLIAWTYELIVNDKDIATHFQNKKNGIMVRKMNGKLEFINYKNMLEIYRMKYMDEESLEYKSEKNIWHKYDSIILDKANADLIQQLYLEKEKSPLKIIVED